MFQFAQKALFDHSDALNLAFGGEAFVETLIEELFHKPCPRGDELLEDSRAWVFTPLAYQILLQSEIGKDSNEGFQRDAAREFVFFIGAPNPLHHRPHRFEIIRYQFESAIGLCTKIF